MTRLHELMLANICGLFVVMAEIKCCHCLLYFMIRKHQ